MALYRAAALLLLFLAHVALCAVDYYKVLGIDKDATDKEIKSAYRNLSRMYHPDKNPSEDAAEKFVEVATAYEALINPNTRVIYDTYGADGLKERQGKGKAFHPHDPFDLFGRFFGGDGHFGHREGQRRGPNVEVRVGISLSDFYNGKTTEFQWDKQQICDKCEGTGSADGVVETCTHCNGHGIRIEKHHLAPGMFQQIQTQCSACGGRGKTVRRPCPVCNGARVVRRPATVQLHVGRGVARDSRVVFENDADASPDYVAGDLIVTLAEKEPDEADNPDRLDGPFFRRRGPDLFWTEVLSLREAWMGGWSRNLTHMDGHLVRLGRARGQVVQPGHTDSLEGEGMPLWHEEGDSVYHETEFGRLHVQYVVVLPDQMEAAMEHDFWALFETWRAKIGVDLHKDSGRPDAPGAEGGKHDEL